MAGVLDFIYSFRTLQQFLALYRKNALVAWRNWRATVLRLCASFIFLLLALIIDKALNETNRRSSNSTSDTNPSPESISAIPSCHSDMYIGSHACVELIYSPNNTVTQQIMGQVVANNPISIAAMAFVDAAAANLFLYNHPDYAIGAVQFIFNATSSALQGFVLQTNSTSKQFKGQYQNLNTFVQLPLQVAVQREIARYKMNQLGMSSVADQLAFDIGLVTFAHPVIDTTSPLSYVLGPFIFAACMFSFVMQMAAMVMEKEAGLKQALRTMGMTDTAYWMSWQAWEITLSFVSANLIALFGMLLQFRIFLVNDYGCLFFLFFLFYISMSSLAMLLTTCFSRAQSAVYMGFVMFLIGWIMQVVVIFGVPYVPDYYEKWGGALVYIFSIFPWDLLTKGFLDLGSATVGSNPGISWSQRYSYCKNIPNESQQPPYDPTKVYMDYECVMPLGTVYIVLVILWIGFFVLAVYFDNIVKNEHGVNRPPWYFLVPSYWFPRPAAAGTFLQRVLTPNKLSPPPEGELDDDVLHEQKRMQALLNHRTGAPGSMAEEVAVPNAVEVYGLQKMYPGGRGICGGSFRCCEACDCCSCVKSEPFWSIKGSWFAIEQNSLFCLLGPNGAGKTTTINCLTGVIPASHGEALVYGEAIGSQGGLDRIRSVMGVCPQFDVLWGELNGYEHLNLYGAVKGLPWRGLSAEAAVLLEKVKLTPAGHQRTSAYSGGMKRRLSVAIALLGDPKVVYLDEPTTGMDPISRRYVWDIIQEAKVGRAIVLTTHSMEEADILGDRIAIMARGRLRCLGSSIRLKQRFGAGYQIALSVMSANLDDEQDVEARTARADRVRQYVRDKLGLEPVEESKAYISYVIHRSRESELVRFLSGLESGDRQALGLTDVQLSLTSLEEVFLNIARKAEIEVAQALGDTETEVTLDDGSLLAVPLGAEAVQHPETGVLYKVRWGQDDQGHLVVLSTMAVPAGAPAAPPVTYPPKQSIMESAQSAVAAPAPAPNNSGGYRPGSGGSRPGSRGPSMVHPSSPSPRIPPQPGTVPGFISLEDPHGRPASSSSGGWQNVH